MIKTVSLFVAVPLLFALSGCEFKKCEGDECDFDSVFDEDAGANGGDGGEVDAGDADGGDGDGGSTGGKADGGSTGEAITIEEFCTAQLAVAQAWADQFDHCCGSVVAGTAEVRAFLKGTLLYPEDAFNTCVMFRKAPIDAGRTEFEPTKAMACAEAFASAYAPPPTGDACAGFDLTALEGMIGHGAPSLKQIPACRQAFAGSVLSSQACTDQFECSGNLRCRSFSGSGMTNKACQSALGSGGACVSNSDCDDGLTCVGNDQASGRQCLPKNDLSFAGNCSFSSECVDGRICNDQGLCAPATGGTVICQSP